MRYSSPFRLLFSSCSTDRSHLNTEHREDVAAAIFAYFEILKSSPPQEWAFKEVNQLSQIAFKFKEKSPATSTAMYLSLQMAKPYPRELLLSAPYLTSLWDQEIIDYATRHLTVEQCRMMIAAKEELKGEKYEMKEKWYGTEFTILPISERLMKAEKDGNDYSDLALPGPNTFIPTNLEIQNKVEVTEVSFRVLKLELRLVADEVGIVRQATIEFTKFSNFEIMVQKR